MSLERKQIPLGAKVAAIVTLGGAAALAACGGKSEGGVKPTPTRPANSPVATETIEPTATREPPPSPESTPTPGPIPDPKKIFDELIAPGFAETPVTPEQVNTVDQADLDAIKLSVANCNLNLQPITPKYFETFTKDSQQYGFMVDNECQTVGEATKQLYLATGNEKFFEANQLWRRYHKAVFDFLHQHFGFLTPDQWATMDNHYYSLEK